MRLAIIGAGMAGLSAARRLMDLRPDAGIVIFEKSRGPGGRAATRERHGARFDHGAQYIKAPTPELESLLRMAGAGESLVDIGRPVWTFDGTGRIEPGDPAQNAEPKWIYCEGITTLAKALARGFDLRYESRIQHIDRANGSYLLFDESDAIVAAADAVLLTPPAPQTQAIIAASALPPEPQASILAELARATYRPCLTLTLGYPPTLREQPFYALVNIDRQHPISWLAYEHLKPGRRTGDQHILIAQMAPGWSADHWDDALPELTAHITRIVSELLGESLPAPRWADRQGWRYALPDRGAEFERLNRALPGLYFAGDYTAGQGRVHLAIEQGWRVAEHIAAFAP
jgi:renalase